MSVATTPERIVVLIPVFNDWEACRVLLHRLAAVMQHERVRTSIVLVDDGSYPPPDLSPFTGPARPFASIAVLTLRRNLGHQRAICVGLAHIESKLHHDFVVIMDSDGEDDPEDVPRLLRAARQHEGRIVFAHRSKRSESILFRACYAAFKLIHRAATGHGIGFGNFSVIPRARLHSLVVVSDLWNNYAGSVLVSRQPYCSVPTRRAVRLAGAPKMNFTALVVHGLSGLAVFGEILAVRLAAASSLLFMAVFAGTGSWWALAGMPVSALAVSGALLLGLGVVLLFALLLGFVFLARRSTLSFQPLRDHEVFIHRIDEPAKASAAMGV